MRRDQSETEKQLEQLRGDLSRAQEASNQLEMQKLENGKLKDTVDNLRLEVESLSQRMRLSAASYSDLSASPQARLRTLGSELGSDESDTEEGESEPDQSIQETPATRPSIKRTKTIKPDTKTIERHIIYKTRNVASVSF